MISRVRARSNGLAWLGALGCLWLWTWKHLSIEWGNNEQYQYCFAVPFLFLFLVWENWKGKSNGQRLGLPGGLALGLAGILFLFGELLRQHDPMWRLAGGSLMLSATLATAVWFQRCGGRPLLGRLAFPLFFAWMAMPWPVPMELAITQNLLAILTSATVFFMNGLGIPALQRGNVIELVNGQVGMSTACSGIQSLQASLMAGLFLGAFQMLSWRRRTALVAIALTTACVANFARVSFIVSRVHLGGEEAAHRWHDKAGGTASIVIYLIILIASYLLAAETKLSPRNDAEWPSTTLTGSDGIALLSSVLLAPAMAWGWFATLTQGSLQTLLTPMWSLRSDSLPADWQAKALEPIAGEHALLQYSERESVSVQTPEGSTARIVHFFWKPGESMPSVAFYHTPQMCMPWMGWTEVANPHPVTMEVNGKRLPFVQYQFEMDNLQMVVYQCLCAGGHLSAFMLNPAAIADRHGRLSMLWRAPREQVNEELLVYIPVVKMEAPHTTDAKLEEILAHILHENPVGAP